MTTRIQKVLAAAIVTIAGCGGQGQGQRQRDDEAPDVTTAESALNASADFAGSFTTSDPGSFSGCASANALSGWCGCPEGSTSWASFRLLHDSFGGIRGGAMHYCAPPTRASNDFGGAFQVDDPVAGGLGCRVGNALNGDACSCPSGTTAIPLRVIVDSSAGWIGSTVNYCRRSSPTGFGGAFQQDDAVAGGRGCRKANPFTGRCSCPSGYTKNQSMRAIVDGSAGGFIGSTIHTCAPGVPRVALCAGQMADPTGNVSARAALQACIDAAIKSTRVLTLPPGDFLIDGDDSTGLTITSQLVITTQGAFSQGPCLSSGSIRCAHLLAAPTLHRNGGIVKITGSFVTLDHIILDGNRAGRVNSAAWNDCASGFNRNGFNAQVDHAFGVSFTNSASINAVCGTGLEWRGDSANIQSSNFWWNGDHNSQNMWADGLTLLQSDDAFVQSNRFENNSDIGFIVGGARNGNIQFNTVVQIAQKAFGGFMMDNFNHVSSGVFDGATIASNLIVCSPWSQCDFGVNIGPDAWYNSGPISGGTFTQNTVLGGYIALNVGGAAPIRITANSVSTDAQLSNPGCLFVSQFNVTPDSVVDTDMPVQTRQYLWDCHP